MPRRVRYALTALLIALPAWSWGPAGHHIIAIVAEQRLSPQVREKIRNLLLGGKYSMVDISTCADQLRSSSRGDAVASDMCQLLAGDVPDTNATWHYIQIPVPTNAETLDAFCPQGDCVTAKISSFAGTLRTSNDAAEQRQALLFLTHLVGDIHQPLHAVNRACDKGGNSERVTFSLGAQNHSGVSLHHVWDTAELELLMSGYKVTEERAIAEAILASIPPEEAEKWARATPEQMAWESYRIAIAQAYAAVPYQNFCGNKDLPPISTDLSPAYEEDGAKIVQKQLMKAGVRLAAMLEAALGDH